jgi:phytoene dehydrogenase-like protein
MGAIITELEKNALKKGVTFKRNAKVGKIDVENGSVRRIILENGETIEG